MYIWLFACAAQSTLAAVPVKHAGFTSRCILVQTRDGVVPIDNVTSAAVCVYLGDEIVEVEVSFAGQSTQFGSILSVQQCAQ